MDYQDLKEQCVAVPTSKQADYRQLFSFAGVAGDVWPQFRAHLEASSTADEFFESIYADDDLRMENVWAHWAKMKKKPWVDRFEADAVIFGQLQGNRGIFVKSADEGSQNELIIPMMGRGRNCSIYLFSDNGFNEKAATFYGSIWGKHTCCELALDGAFDIYIADKALIFERWSVDALGRREGNKGQIRTGCDCAATW
ncbi:MAG: hypothetical protein HFJ65_06015 [Eggerthellaceae bacterium]|nr:hypothetical protein [Eggerthellaceae bacterium]